MITKLNQITLCCIDCSNPLLAKIALEKSQSLCEFGDVFFFTDSENLDFKKIANNVIKIKKITSMDQYNFFILKELSRYIKTDYVLVIQWDGFVIDNNAWSNEFLKYDYIGAQWFWHNDDMKVGNGGFSLRSKKLLDTMATDNFPFIPNLNEDEQICRYYRTKLFSNYSINFAPVEIADLFSYERSIPNNSTFGFHGFFNFWRHLDDSELRLTISQINPNYYNSIEYYELIINYFNLRKFNSLRFLLSPLVTKFGEEYVKNKLSKLTNNLAISKLILSNLKK